MFAQFFVMVVRYQLSLETDLHNLWPNLLEYLEEEGKYPRDYVKEKKKKKQILN